MAREREARRREENETEFARIVAFSDGVFAIAITLLVLNLGIRKGLANDEIASALWGQREQLIAYGISFAVIGRFWIVHHRFFGDVRAFDGRLMALNMFYLAWIVLVPFSSEVLGEYGGRTAAVVLYSANLAGAVLVGQWMAYDARRGGLAATDRLASHESVIRSTFIAGIFLLSIPVAFLNAHVAQYMWLLLFLDPSPRLAPLTSGRARRRDVDLY